ncbi:MAG: ATP-binding protein [Candidatus Gastranaerophilales bacterium]|nr:ATP-binding protein [Candidatus Gastranaerophilales bacterium]
MRIVSLNSFNFGDIKVMQTNRQKRREKQREKEQSKMPVTPPNPRAEQTKILGKLDKMFQKNSDRDIQAFYQYKQNIRESDNSPLPSHLREMQCMQPGPYSAELFERQKQAIVKADSAIKERELLLEERLAALKFAIKDIEEEDSNYFDKTIAPLYNSATNPNVPQAHHKRKGFDRIVGYDYEKEVLQKVFISRVKQERQGRDVGVYASILFFGPQENGKSSITRAVAQEAGCRMIELTPNSTDVEESFEYLEELTQKAQEAEENFKKDQVRTIIFIDEIDKVLNDDSPIQASLMKFIKNCSKDYHCTIFASTNNPLSMGFDVKDHRMFPIRMSIDTADDKTKKELFEHYLLDSDKEELDYEQIIQEIKNQEQAQNAQFSNGQIKLICSRLQKQSKEQKITTQDVLKAIQDFERTPDITQEVAQKFKKEHDIIIKGNKVI